MTDDDDHKMMPCCDDHQSDDTPSVGETEASLSVAGVEVEEEEEVNSGQRRLPLQWTFKGVTLWCECEEYDQDLTKALQDASQHFGIQQIPRPHVTAIYGMTHLTEEQALEKFQLIGEKTFPNGCWPSLLDPPISVKQDLAVEGRPGEVCSISWAELAFKTNQQHEEAIDKLWETFELPYERPHHRWTPHISLAYDNPDDTVLNLPYFISYIAKNPSLMEATRRVKSMSLWSMKGKMSQWKCLGRHYFPPAVDDS